MYKHYFYIVARAVALAAILLFFVNCQQRPFLKSNRLSIKWRDADQEIMIDGSLHTFKDSVYIYFHDNYTIYQRTYTRSYSKLIMDKNQNVVGEKWLREDTAYHYLVYKEKNKWCYSFDSLSLKKMEKVNIDTFRIKSLLQGYPFYPKKDILLVKSNLSEDKDILVEKYVYKVKADYTYADTLYYYFDKRLVGINFTLSKEMDSLKKSKLVKVIFAYNKVPKGQLRNGKIYPFDIPRKELLTEISLNKTGETTALTNFINLFKSKEKELYNDN